MTRFDVAPPRVFRILLVLIAAVLALHLLAVLTMVIVGGPHQVAWWALRFFSVDSEDSLPTAYSIVMLALVAVLAAQIALLTEKRALRWGWALIAVIFAFMSWDEGATIHETVGYYLEDAGLSGPFAYGWLIVGIPAVVLVGILLLAMLRSLPRALLGRMVLAGVIFVSGAIGVEIIASYFAGAGVEGQTPGMLLLTTLEEGCEMLGVAYFFVVLLRHRAVLEAQAGVRIVRRGVVPAAVVEPEAAGAAAGDERTLPAAS